MDHFLTVNVVTPAGLVYDHHAKIVVARTTDGEFGILPRHAPIIVPLAIDGKSGDFSQILNIVEPTTCPQRGCL